MAVLLAGVALTCGTAVAASHHGGHRGPAPAPMHHSLPPAHHVEHHHGGHHGGEGLIGGLIGGLVGGIVGAITR